VKQQIKDIVARILYLDNSEEISDTASLYLDLNMSSIDYVDLCYELKEKVRDTVSLENLWPFNRMFLDPALYAASGWTQAGWQEVCRLMAWSDREPVSELSQLYAYFSVEYIERRIGQLN